MRTWDRTSRLLLLPFRFPAILVLSLVYAGALYAAILQAGLLDIANPFWVLSAGALLLLSPIYHALLLRTIDSALRGIRVDWRAALADWPSAFPRLLLGEILVGVAVALGGLLLVIPGIYVGMRLIYYKQAIVLGRAPTTEALRDSVRHTDDWRLIVGLFVGLAALYGCVLGLDTLLVATAPSAAVHIGSVVGSALLLAWMNVLVTASYVRCRDKAVPPQAPTG
jgi:hypothetical protein